MSATLCLVPFVAVLLVVMRYGVNVPYLDQWELVPLLEKGYLGELTLHDLWTQQNEHRIFFPKLIMLNLARFTRWDIRYELAMNLTLALCLFAVLAYQVRATGRVLSLPGWHRLTPVVSLIVFSIAQYQNWLWGFQGSMFLNLLAVSAGIVLLSGQSSWWVRFAGAAALGVVGTFSFGNGMLFWPIGLLQILVVTKGAKQQAPSIVGWAMISVLIIGIFLYHYERSNALSPVAVVLSAPLESVRFVFKFLGGIIAQYSGGDSSWNGKFALVYGLAGMSVLVWAGSKLLRDRTASLTVLLPYLGLSLYSLGSGVVTSMGRLALGSDHAVASRYGTMVVPFWTSLAVVLYLLVACERESPDARASADQKAARWLLQVLICLFVLGSGLALNGARKLSRVQNDGRRSLLALARDPQAKVDYRQVVALYPRAATIITERYPILERRGLSLFKEGQ